MLSLGVLIIFIVILVYKTAKTDGSEGREAFIFNPSHPQNCLRIMILTSWANRRTGLLNHLSIREDEGYLFKNTKKIHTKGMMFPIDVLFLDKENKVVAIRENIPPQGITVGPKETCSTLELAANAARKQLNINCHDQLVVTS